MFCVISYNWLFPITYPGASRWNDTHLSPLFLVSTRPNCGPFAPHPPPGGDNKGAKSQTD
ncbi:unnamed protein product, partial [Ectocarpus sp. 13 AM-2016]